MSWRGLAKRAAKLAVGAAALPALTAAALRERLRAAPARPRVFFGTLPLINIKYHAQALRAAGYEVETIVDHLYPINRAEDFDLRLEDLTARLPLADRLPGTLRHHLGHYAIFLHALRHSDLFNYYFDGLILRDTPLHHLELQLLRLAGKRTVLMPYGADVQVIERIKSPRFKAALEAHYPDQVRRAPQIAAQMEYCNRHADVVISGVDWVDSMTRWDLLLAGHFAIDTAYWTCPPRPPEPGRPVRVLHAINHPELKGTALLEAAVERLQADGVPIELVRLQGVPNAAVREAMAECDIVADQFVIGWYAMFALEGMSMGKPVLTYLRPDLRELYARESWAGSCPIVDTPPEAIEAELRRLVEDPELRRRLGAEGRAYVEAHHSLEAIGRLLSDVYERVWAAPSASR